MTQNIDLENMFEKKESSLLNEYDISNYYIANRITECWACGKNTNVWGIVLLPKEPYTTVQRAKKSYKNENYPAFIIYVEKLANSVTNEINKYTKHYKQDYSKMANTTYFINHCEHCNAKIGDFKLYQDVDGAFFITGDEEGDIKFYKIDKLFSGSGSPSTYQCNFISKKL